LVVFGAFLSVFFLGRKLKNHNWAGVFICTLAGCIIGIAAQSSGGDPTYETLGVVFILGAQFVQASQFVFEELLLHDFDAPALVVVGMEGVWGLVISVCISIPLCWYLPGDDVGGHYENFEDSVVKMENSTTLVLVMLAYWVGVLGYNVCAILVTQEMSAVHHTFLDGFRTISVWTVSLLTYYIFPDSGFGEPWNESSYLQLVGFTLMIYGTLVYDGSVGVPGMSILNTGSAAETLPLFGESSPKLAMPPSPAFQKSPGQKTPPARKGQKK